MTISPLTTASTLAEGRYLILRLDGPDLRAQLRALEAEVRYANSLRMLDDEIRELGEVLVRESRGTGRLWAAAEVMPAHMQRRFTKAVQRPAMFKGTRRALNKRRDRWPGGERRSRPTATFRARWCSWRRAA